METILFKSNQLYLIIFQNKKNSRVNSLGTLRPDYSTIDAAKFSDQPQDWLLHPTGITFEFDVKRFIAFLFI